MRLWPHLAAVTFYSTVVLQSSPQQQDIERRIDALLARMTLEEKIGQMSQSTSMATPMSDRIKDEIRKGRWGSFLNAGSPADRQEAQRIATEESRLRIPLIFGRDVIHGYRTIFPIPLGQAASWNPDLIAKAARQAAIEASLEGIHWTFAPMIDITRDPRWGRVAESLGEDPHLTGVLGVAMIRGFQGESLANARSLAATAKHYAGYGAAEAGRDYNSTWIPEVQLREVFLPPFRMARDAGVATFMTSFNAVNGVPATANRLLLERILRGEWKFDGVVVSDYEAVVELIEHGYAADPRDAARKSVLAGVDMEMVSTAYFDHLKTLVESGKVDVKVIDQSVRRILRLKFQLGLFDGRGATTNTAKVTPESRSVAKHLAAESAVLLKNERSALPLKKDVAKVAVIGPLANSPVDQMGTWVMDGRVEEVETPLAALRKALGNDRVVFARALKNSRDISHTGFAEAVQAARGADVVLLFLGEEHVLSGEARSRAFLSLPGAQEALVAEIAKTGRPVIAVVMAGRPLTFHDAGAKVDAVLYAWHPGAMGGPAIADLLFGNATPSGKLPITFPRTVGQIPIYYSHLNTGRPASAAELGIPMGDPANPQGYTSKYVDVDFTPEYPFGYGLSYTSFAYSNPKLSAERVPKNGQLTVSADVSNTGSRVGEEIVQLYVGGPSGASISRPVRELKGFQRVALKPGEKKAVQFSLAVSDLAFYNEDMHLVTEPGAYQVWIAPDSARGVPATFTVD